jgi:DnaK suppressor protein
MKEQTIHNGDRTNRLRKMLLRKRAEVEDRIGEELEEKVRGEDLDSVLGPALDKGDLSYLDLEQDVDYELLNKYTQTLKNIDEALERLDDGTYGICEECGEQIGEKRLQAVPFALCCVDCQREKENVRETDYGRIWMERRALMAMKQAGANEDEDV